MRHCGSDVAPHYFWRLGFHQEVVLEGPVCLLVLQQHADLIRCRPPRYRRGFLEL